MNNQAKKAVGCAYSNRNILKICMKFGGYQRLELRVRIVVDYADTRISSCVIEYVRENEKVCETKTFEQKIEVENFVTLPI